jgi:uncharacterized repeat protein (TIGR03803 family)
MASLGEKIMNHVRQHRIMAVSAILALTVAAGLLASREALSAPADQVLYNFMKAQGDDHSPSGLIRDAAGNLYGTTYSGLAGQAGNVFELSPQQGGGWNFTVLHKFKFMTSDGAYPSGSPTMDAAGNLYGVTKNGGTGCPGEGSLGCGIVYELSPNEGGGWTEKILYNFQGNTIDGIGPLGSLTFDAEGNLYGTTVGGGVGDGDLGGGTVYELSPQSGGSWTEKVLYTFVYPGQAGYAPSAGVIFSANGNLYGTTYGGGSDPSCSGSYGCGTVFELSSDGNGNWTETVLHNFKNNSPDGVFPVSNLLMDATGNLYGATSEGGSYAGSCDGYGCGVVYELSLKQNGLWKEKILYSFLGNGMDGIFPAGNILFDPSGNIYGAAYKGGNHGKGAIFELVQPGTGKWTEKIRHNFGSSTNDGHYPNGVVLDPLGDLYGTTSNGGTYDGGTVFQLVD